MRTPDRNRRSFYRVVYPRELRPVFISPAGWWPVIDLSERGMRLLAPGDAILPSSRALVTAISPASVAGSGNQNADGPEPPRVDGFIRLPDGRGRHRVAGAAVYRIGHSVGVALDADQSFPVAAIMAEQRLLIKQGHLRREDPEQLAALRVELGLRDN